VTFTSPNCVTIQEHKSFQTERSSSFNSALAIKGTLPSWSSFFCLPPTTSLPNAYHKPSTLPVSRPSPCIKPRSSKSSRSRRTDVRLPQGQHHIHGHQPTYPFCCKVVITVPPADDVYLSTGIYCKKSLCPVSCRVLTGFTKVRGSSPSL